MLYLIESDVVYDTVTHEREAVIKDDLYKALNLGIQIVGVRLENGALTVYDWRLINRQKLRLYGVLILRLTVMAILLLFRLMIRGV